MTRDNGIAVALTGASGACYGLRLIECLLQAGRRVHVLYSSAAQVVVKMETGLQLSGQATECQHLLAEHFNVEPGQLQVYGRRQWTASVASGSNPPDALVVCPCTMGTLASIAHGISEDLIDRAADVMLKERRKLILVIRETPFSSIHLQNMLSLSQAGALIMPANPGFYNQPKQVSDLVDFMVARILDHLGVEQNLLPRWGEDN